MQGFLPSIFSLPIENPKVQKKQKEEREHNNDANRSFHDPSLLEMRTPDQKLHATRDGTGGER